jgi:hypothetical protein
MIIKALKTFSDGAISLHEGEIANVPDVKAQLFINAGYAVEYTGEGGEIDLSAYAKKTDVETTAFDVAKDIEGIETIKKFVVLDIESESKFVDKTTGSLVSNSDGYGVEIPVVAGETYRITGTYQGSKTGLYALIDSSHNLTSYPASDSGHVLLLTKETVEVTIPANTEHFRVGSYKTPFVIEKLTNEDTLEVSKNTDYLYGKKWAVCGDSYTVGDFTGYVDSQGNSGENSDAYDPDTNRYKTYPWWIGKRNNMNVKWIAQAGNDFTNISGATRPFSSTDSAGCNYSLIPSDCDYITLAFGLNETDLTSEQIGTKTDSDNTTLWGAYNVVLEDILTKNPTVKIGIIISDSYLTENYHDALVAIAKYWGVPYLDLKGDERVSMNKGGKFYEHSTVAETLRDNAFKVSATNTHPNVKAHEYRSTIIENFLRSL